MKLKNTDLQVLRSLKTSLKPFVKELTYLEKRKNDLEGKLNDANIDIQIISTKIDSIKETVLTITQGVPLELVNFETGIIGELDPEADETQITSVDFEDDNNSEELPSIMTDADEDDRDSFMRNNLIEAE